jgi:hypothetical protein
MDAMDFAHVLRMLRGFFSGCDQPFAVVGGLGLAAHGIGRTTFDIDIVVDVEVQEPLIGFLESQGYETLHRSSGYSNHLNSEALGGRVDVVYLRGETSRQIFEDAILCPGPGGLDMPVPRPEHLAAMKVFAMKNDPSRTLGELADIRQLLGLPGVDREEIRSYFIKYGLEGVFEQLEDLR